MKRPAPKGRGLEAGVPVPGTAGGIDSHALRRAMLYAGKALVDATPNARAIASKAYLFVFDLRADDARALMAPLMHRLRLDASDPVFALLAQAEFAKHHPRPFVSMWLPRTVLRRRGLSARARAKLDSVNGLAKGTEATLTWLLARGGAYNCAINYGALDSVDGSNLIVLHGPRGGTR